MIKSLRIGVKVGLCAIVYFVNSFFAMSQESNLCGTYKPYPLSDFPSMVAPEGYRLIFVNHLGRHGSRFPVSDKDVSYLISLLNDEKKDGNLSVYGERLLSLLRDFDKACENNWGELSALGAVQLEKIGEWLGAYIPDSTKMVKIWCDPKTRCVQSMNAFLNGAALNRDRAEITMMQLHNPLLNFFKVNPNYIKYKEDGLWKQLIDEYSRSSLSGVDWLDVYLKDASKYDSARQIEFATKLFSVVTIAPNVGFDFASLPTNSSPFMECLWRVDNATEYMLKGPSPICDNLQVDISLPLLMNFLRTSESAIVGGDYAACLRFAHAETLMPFVALLGIPEASVSTSVTTDIYKVWLDYEISPMAANLEWLFYRNPSGDCLVRMMLNGKDARFPVATDTFPFYKWEDVHRYYLEMVDNTDLSNNFDDFLDSD